MHTLKAIVLQKTPRSSARLKGLGVVVSLAIAAAAIFALMHALKNVDYDEVFAVVRRTSPGVIAVALMLVAVSYASLTLYDLLALRTICAVPHIAPAGHRTTRLGVFDVANISFLTGLTFWLGNLTALALSLLCAPDAISLINYLPPRRNRGWRGAAVVRASGSCSGPGRARKLRCAGRCGFRQGSAGRSCCSAIGSSISAPRRWRCMCCSRPGSDIGIFRVIAVFIAATLLGFASHTPAGIGVFDAAYP